jgi:hypothetical protein
MWEEELAGMRERIKRHAPALVAKLQAAGVKGDLATSPARRACSATRACQGQMQRLRSEFGVYGVDSGRICVAALNSRNIDAVAGAGQGDVTGTCLSPTVTRRRTKPQPVFSRIRVGGPNRQHSAGAQILLQCTKLRLLSSHPRVAGTSLPAQAPRARPETDEMLYQLYETQRA